MLLETSRAREFSVKATDIANEDLNDDLALNLLSTLLQELESIPA